MRNSTEVAQRALAILAVIGKAYQGNNEKLLHWISDNKINSFFSDIESKFIHNKTPSQNEILNLSWRAEALTSLLWSLNVIDEMPGLEKEFDICSLSALSNIMADPTFFIAQAQLRPNKEIIDKEMELFDKHWQVRDAALFKKDVSKELHPSVVYERRYGLTWLVDLERDWDNVRTDT